MKPKKPKKPTKNPVGRPRTSTPTEWTTWRMHVEDLNRVDALRENYSKDLPYTLNRQQFFQLLLSYWEEHHTNEK